ncbi:hypothetical protein Tco_0368715 [Tanacetum coccineum]
MADEVTRQLNTVLPNLLTQLVQALGGNRANQREVTPSCNIKTFRASCDKNFFRHRAPEIKPQSLHPNLLQIQGAVSIGPTVSTTDGIKDDFKKKENAGNKRRGMTRTETRGRDERNERDKELRELCSDYFPD